MADKRRKGQRVQPGMKVDTPAGDLGDKDMSAAHIAEVQRDEAGQVEKVVVEKGRIFKKEIEVPADRIQTPAAPDAAPNTVTLAVSEEELDALHAAGAETLPAEQPATPSQADDPLEQAEEELPTAEGLRRKEGRGARNRPAHQAAVAASSESTDAPSTNPLLRLARQLGPGFLAGMAGNDSSAVTSYSVDGATTGYSQLWLLLLATPLFQAVQYACARIGRVSQQGLAELLREHYGRRLALPASLMLLLANTALIAADLAAIGSGLELLTGIKWLWFVVPVALLLWYLTLYQSFGVLKKVFVALSLAFVTYLVTALWAGADWGTVLKDTFVPQLGVGLASISSAVALLGATVSPYTMFWQAQGEKEEQRPGTQRQQLRLAAWDIGSGVLSGNLVAYSIIVCTSATLFLHHQQIQTAADAARALEPLLGPVAKYLFAIGLIGAGLVAIPVLLASTSYALAGTIGWAASLWKKPWQNEGFYLILTGALAVSLVIALLGIDPIQLMFWANVLQGILSPALVICVLLVGNNRAIMGKARLGKLTNVLLGATALIMLTATALLFYGLATGQGG
jgi:Mn2+/Fe2+ NRAMP family transporter